MSNVTPTNSQAKPRRIVTDAVTGTVTDDGQGDRRRGTYSCSAVSGYR